MLVVALLTAAAAPITLAIVWSFAAGVVLATVILRRMGDAPRLDRDLAVPDGEARSEPASPGGGRFLQLIAKSEVAPASYGPLNAYLQGRHASYVVLTFEQVESLLGFSLPAVARTEMEWWTSQADHADGHTQMWTAAGRTAMPNLLARNVAFTRVT